MPDEVKYLKCGCESCGGHLEYPRELAGSTIECPHCKFSTPLPAPPHAKAPKPAITTVIAAIMLLLVGGIAYGTWKLHTQGDDTASTSLPSPAPAEIAHKDATHVNNTPTLKPAPAPAPVPAVPKWDGMDASSVTLLKTGEGSLVYAVGELTNVTAQQKFGVKVMVDLFDKDGDKIGSATDYAQSIDAGKAWRYRAMVVDRGAVKAELEKVTED